MSKIYFGFGIADGMFSGDLNLKRKDLHDDAGYVQYLLNNPSAVFAEEAVICLNPSHELTIRAMETKYDLSGIAIPDKAPVVKLEKGDHLIVMSPRGLPRLEGRHEYTEEEINNASFNFALWTVMED